MALRCWSALTNGMGGIDWAGFEVFCGINGVADPEDLFNRVIVIKLYEKPKPLTADSPAPPAGLQ